MKPTAAELHIDIARRPITSEREPIPQYPLGTGEVYAKNYRLLSGLFIEQVYGLGPQGSLPAPTREHATRGGV